MSTNTSKMTKKQLLKTVDERIQNMSTKGVYHPRRMKPKWDSLKTDGEKLALFEKYVTAKDASIGLRRLVKVNLCHKTLESVIIENPSAVEHLQSKDVMAICVAKLSLYDNGVEYLKTNSIKVEPEKDNPIEQENNGSN